MWSRRRTEDAAISVRFWAALPTGIGLEVGRGVWDALLVGSTPAFPTMCGYRRYGDSAVTRVEGFDSPPAPKPSAVDCTLDSYSGELSSTLSEGTTTPGSIW
jgi:hypothetical protein